MDRTFVCAGADAFCAGTLPSRVLGNSALALTAQQVLRPRPKVYTILTGHIKKNRLIFEANSHQILTKLTINSIYLQKDFGKTRQQCCFGTLFTYTYLDSGLLGSLEYSVLAAGPQRILGSITVPLAAAEWRFISLLLDSPWLSLGALRSPPDQY